MSNVGMMIQTLLPQLNPECNCVPDHNSKRNLLHVKHKGITVHSVIFHDRADETGFWGISEKVLKDTPGRYTILLTSDKGIGTISMKKMRDIISSRKPNKKGYYLVRDEDIEMLYTD